MDPTIYIPRIIAQEGIDYLAEHGISVKVGTSIEEDVMCQEVRGCQGILVRTGADHPAGDGGGARPSDHCAPRDWSGYY